MALSTAPAPATTAAKPQTIHDQKIYGWSTKGQMMMAAVLRAEARRESGKAGEEADVDARL